MSVCLSVCLSIRLFLQCPLNRLIFELELSVRVWVMDHDPSSPAGIEIKSRSRLAVRVRVEYRLTAIVRFHCHVNHQLHSSAARRAAWHGGGQWQRHSPARVGVVTRSV